MLSGILSSAISQSATDLPNAVASRIRAAQIKAVLRYTPWTMLANILNGTVVVCVVAPQVGSASVIAWALALVLTTFLGVRGWYRGRTNPALVQGWVSPRGLKRAAIHAGVLGLVWGAVPAMWFGHVDGMGQLVIANVTTGMICAGGFALATVPRGAFAYVGIMSVGGFVGLASSGEPGPMALSALLLTYGVIVAGAVFNVSRMFVERFKAEAALTERGQVIGLLLHEFEAHGSNWLFELDPQFRLQAPSARLAEVTGRAQAALDGQSLLDLIAPEDRAAMLRSLERRAAFRDLVVRADAAVGDGRWWSLSASPMADAAGRLVGYRGVGSDVTASKASADRVAWLAAHDSLTAMVNRRSFLDSADLILATCEPDSERVALIYIDLDDFKAVNDTLGHACGDQLLCEVAHRLAEVASGVLASSRLGGDEFALLLRVAPECDTAQRVADALIARLSEPYFLDGTRAVIGASIGISFGPQDGATAGELLRNADLALYAAKEAGRNCHRLFEPEMHRRADDRRALQLDLMQALERQELELVYQPLIAASDQAIQAFEALLRWNHPTRGRLAPDRFIAVAEASGLIVPIGEWVVRQACADAARWPAHVRVAVNLSPAQLTGGVLVQSVRDALQRSGLAPHRLELEVTEAIFVQNSPVTAQVLDDLRALGIVLALDDFGTGYSSLGYLCRYPFHKIKIDRMFVSGTGARAQREAVVRAVTSMAQALDMVTTAEGVETPEQFAWIRSLGCTEAQGYFFSRPVSYSDASAMVAAAARPAA